MFTNLHRFSTEMCLVKLKSKRITHTNSEHFAIRITYTYFISYFKQDIVCSEVFML